MLSSNLGYPRIGPNRELKWILESYWSKKINQETLFKEISNIKKNNWIKQKNAGLNNCTLEEYSFFNKMNNEFKLKFDIPFIFAVKGSNKKIIIEEFKRRLKNDDINKEFNESIKQVKKIAYLRLEDIVNE